MSITDLYASLYDVPRERVEQAGRLRGLAAEIRDRGATVDPDGPRGAGASYWPEVARLLRRSYRSLSVAVTTPDGTEGDGSDASPGADSPPATAEPDAQPLETTAVR